MTKVCEGVEVHYRCRCADFVVDVARRYLSRRLRHRRHVCRWMRRRRVGRCLRRLGSTAVRLGLVAVVGVVPAAAQVLGGLSSVEALYYFSIAASSFGPVGLGLRHPSIPATNLG